MYLVVISTGLLDSLVFLIACFAKLFSRNKKMFSRNKFAKRAFVFSDSSIIFAE